MKFPKVTVVHDDAYEYLDLDKPFTCLYNLPDMYERTIIVSTGGKTFHCTGWKIGWAVA